ncbi:hypothetical protein LDL59_00665 [Kaistella anthropi]|nr:hypothetical protein [Kaistella anthropi]
MEDSKGDYSFDLKETKKIAEIQNFNQSGNVVKVKRKDFVKQEALFRKDPHHLCRPLWGQEVMAESALHRAEVQCGLLIQISAGRWKREWRRS